MYFFHGCVDRRITGLFCSDIGCPLVAPLAPSAMNWTSTMALVTVSASTKALTLSLGAVPARFDCLEPLGDRKIALGCLLEVQACFSVMSDSSVPAV